jgi:hypothetical protein
VNLRVAYSIRRQTLEGLYDVIDKDTEEFIGEPLPHHEALAAKRRAEDIYSATKALASSLNRRAEA